MKRSFLSNKNLPPAYRRYFPYELAWSLWEAGSRKLLNRYASSPESVLSISTAFDSNVHDSSSIFSKSTSSHLSALYLHPAVCFGFLSNQINWLQPENFQAISSNLHAFECKRVQRSKTLGRSLLLSVFPSLVCPLLVFSLSVCSSLFCSSLV